MMTSLGGLFADAATAALGLAPGPAKPAPSPKRQPAPASTAGDLLTFIGLTLIRIEINIGL